MMKIKDGFLLRMLGGNHVVVPVGRAAIDLRGMITLNATGAFLWELLQTPQTEEQLSAAVLAAYDVEEQTAVADVKRFVELLKANDLLDLTEETI